MTDVRFSADDLTVLAQAVTAAQTMFDTLRTIEAWPRDFTIQLDSEIQPGHLGFIGYAEDGETAMFYPALTHTQEKPTNEDH